MQCKVDKGTYIDQTRLSPLVFCPSKHYSMYVQIQRHKPAGAVNVNGK